MQTTLMTKYFWQIHQPKLKDNDNDKNRHQNLDHLKKRNQITSAKMHGKKLKGFLSSESSHTVYEPVIELKQDVAKSLCNLIGPSFDF